MTIRNDATRQSVPVRDARPLRGVVARQGQVLLDTDINEAERSIIDRVETADAAMLGPPDRLLFPAGTTGFAIGGALGAPTIAAGTGYLAGWQLVNPAAATLLTQPNPWRGAVPTTAAAVVLKALVRHIDPAEDPALADVALGDAQASGRAINDWQVFPLPVPAGTTCPAVTGLPAWAALVAPSTGTLAFQIAAPAASDDPCALTPAGGHSRFENLLYRIEVHGGVAAAAGAPTADGPRFRLAGLVLKLSRRNASLMARITRISGTEVTVSPPALDPRAWFAQGAYAEIVGPGDDIDPAAALAKERLFRVALASDEVITLSGLAADIAGTGVQTDGRWFLRLWEAWPDGAGTAVVPASGGPIDLGDGIAVKLAGGAGATFRRGDYWTAAVRADGSIAWPGITTTPVQQPPHGPAIRYAPLAIFDAAGLADCRVPFATLSDRALFYRGGDGQTAFAPVAASPTLVTLPGTLRVAVMRGETPVPGARIRWSPGPGAPASQIDGSPCDGANSPESITGPDGLAEVRWLIDASQQAVQHQVQATLLGTAVATPPVQFSARFATAAATMYAPGKCANLAGVDNVQDALDTLCAKIGDNDPPALTLKSILFTDGKANTVELIREKLILNALEVPFNAFEANIFFGVDAPLEIKPRDFDPIAEIEIDLPYPTTDPDKQYWIAATRPPAGITVLPGIIGPFGFQRVRLDGTIAVVEKGPGDLPGLVWTPSDMAKLVLARVPLHLGGQRVLETISGWKPSPLFDRLLCRLRLRSALIWGTDRRNKRRLYLNAEHLGISAGATGRELIAGEHDPQRAADLDMFVYLTIRRT